MHQHQAPHVVIQIQVVDGLQKGNQDSLEGQIGRRHQGDEEHVVQFELPLAQRVGADRAQKHRARRAKERHHQGGHQGHAQLLHGAGIALQRPLRGRRDGGGGHHLAVGLEAGHHRTPEGQHVEDQEGRHDGVIDDMQHRHVPAGLDFDRLRLLARLAAGNAQVVLHIRLSSCSSSRSAAGSAPAPAPAGSS